MEKEVGKIGHFYDKISVGIVQLSDGFQIGDTLHIKGKKTDFTQEVTSLQLDHAAVESADPGQEIGLKVDQPVEKGDTVFIVTE